MNAHRKRCERQCHIQGKSNLFSFLSVLKLKYLKYKNEQTDKTEPQHLM